MKGLNTSCAATGADFEYSAVRFLFARGEDVLLVSGNKFKFNNYSDFDLMLWAQHNWWQLSG